MCWGISGKGFGGRGVEDTQFLRCTVCWGIFEREEGNQRAQTTPNVCVCTFWGSLREGVEGEEMRTSYCNVHLSTGAAWRKERAHTVLVVMFVVSLVSVLTVMVLRSGCVCCCTWCVYLVSFVLLLPAMLCVTCCGFCFACDEPCLCSVNDIAVILYCRHVSNTDRLGKRYRNIANVFTIGDDEEGQLFFSSTSRHIASFHHMQLYIDCMHTDTTQGFYPVIVSSLGDQSQ